MKRLNKELVSVEKKHESLIEEFRNREFDSKSALQDEVQDLREKLAKAEKKATIQANVHKLEDEVKAY